MEIETEHIDNQAGCTWTKGCNATAEEIGEKKKGKSWAHQNWNEEDRKPSNVTQFLIKNTLKYTRKNKKGNLRKRNE